MKYTSKLILNGEEYEFAAPSGGWQPGVNTLLYLPVDSSDTSSIVYDHSTNQTNFAWYGTASYDTLISGKKVVSFTGSNGLYIDSNIITSQPITMNMRVKRDGTQADSASIFVAQMKNNGQFILDAGAFNQGDTITFWMKSGGIYVVAWNNLTWYNLVAILNGTDISLYLNNQLVGSDSNVTVNLNNIDANSFGFTRSNGDSTNYKYFKGWMGDMIIENKVWTAQEIADYYNQTKSLYGIS